MKGAYGEGKPSPSLKLWAEEGRSREEESKDALLWLRGGRGSGLPGWDWKGKLKADGGGRRMAVDWACSLGTSWMSSGGEVGT